MLQTILNFFRSAFNFIGKILIFLWNASLGALKELWSDKNKIDDTFSVVAWLLIIAFALRLAPVVGLLIGLVAPAINITIAGFGITASLIYLCAHRPSPRDCLKPLLMMMACAAWLALEIGMIPYTVMSAYGMLGILLHITIITLIIANHFKLDTPQKCIVGADRNGNPKSWTSLFPRSVVNIARQFGMCSSIEESKRTQTLH